MFFKSKKNKTPSSDVAEEKGGNPIVQVLKGSIIAVFATIICILIFALIIKLTNVSSTIIKPVNQAIKIVSILIGTLIATRKNKKQGFFKGILIGLVYTGLSFLVFSILDGNFSINMSILNDFLFSGIAGAVSGVIGVNIGRKSKI